MKDKIKFKDLSGWLKFAVIVAWIEGAFICGAFLIGFTAGFLGAY